MSQKQGVLREVYSAIRDYLGVTMRHPIGFFGALLTTLAGALLLILLLMSFFGVGGNPYLGIVTFLFLPAIFLLGLLLMPIGHYRWVHRRRTEEVSAFPKFDFNLPRTRNRFVLFLGVTVLNLVLLVVAAAGGIEFMDSVDFCGKTCHRVMHPELIAHGNSPHARVRCVDCHIGPGASWFVRSKLSGTRQVFATLLHTFPRPIPTPIENLRPARETCEQCHWPAKFHGTRLVVRQHYREDESNTPIETVLALKIGGGGLSKIGKEEPGAGADASGDTEPTDLAGNAGQSMMAATGIHWHVANKVEYASDAKREKVSMVRVHLPDGSVKEFRRPREEESGGSSSEQNATGSTEHPRRLRTMDCVDCHNRPTHIYQPATVALEQAMVDGRVARGLPYIRREALAAMTAGYSSTDSARAGIARSLRGFYATEYPDLDPAVRADLDRSIEAVEDAYARNVFPSMAIDWNTYPNHLGHEGSPGCFRCHDGELATSEGETVSADCGLCHTVLAMEEENPQILQELSPEE